MNQMMGYEDREFTGSCFIQISYYYKTGCSKVRDAQGKEYFRA